MTKSVQSLLDEYIDQEHLYNVEGDSAIKTLCKIARVLGYKDSLYFGQIARDVVIGDFLDFLRDNSGCVEAIIAWIGEQRVPEWADNIESHLEKHDETDEDDE